MDARLVAYLESVGADVQCLDGWQIRPAQRAGKDVAFVITRGPEIHMLSLVEGNAISRRNLREYLRPIIEKFGYATTRVPLAEVNHRLRHALGFTYTWSDDHFSYWALTQVPYVRESEMKKEESPCL